MQRIGVMYRDHTNKESIMHEGKDINPVVREPLSAELMRYS